MGQKLQKFGQELTKYDKKDINWLKIGQKRLENWPEMSQYLQKKLINEGVELCV